MNSIKIILFFLLLLSSANVVWGKDPAWLEKMRKIKLLSDTYDDVVRLLGEPLDRGRGKDTVEYFRFKEGRMWVRFASERCASTIEGEPIGWKVPPYTAIEVSFFPNKWMEPDKLGIKNFRGFTKNPIHEGREGFEYVNDELGIDYTVNGGRIQDLTFRPAKKFDYLRCK